MPVPTRDGPARYEAAGGGGSAFHGGPGGFLITLSPPFGQGPDTCGDSYSRPRIAVPAGRLAHRKIIRA
jgi:hypothetical protein